MLQLHVFLYVCLARALIHSHPGAVYLSPLSTNRFEFFSRGTRCCRIFARNFYYFIEVIHTVDARECTLPGIVILI